MDENAPVARPQQPRIQQNPHLAECPDFSDESFDDLVLTMVGLDRTWDQAIGNLRTAWHNQNNRKKALWDAQVQADQERQTTSTPKRTSRRTRPSQHRLGRHQEEAQTWGLRRHSSNPLHLPSTD
jgi:hypothetical protein